MLTASGVGYIECIHISELKATSAGCITGLLLMINIITFSVQVRMLAAAAPPVPLWGVLATRHILW